MYQQILHNSTLIPQLYLYCLLFICLIMKKVLVAVALVLGLGSSVAFAQEVSNTPAVETQTQAPQDEYTKIEVKDLPEAVTQAIAKSYEDATIKEAYVAEKETGKVYKVIITTKDAQEVTVLLNEKGEEVKEIK